MTKDEIDKRIRPRFETSFANNFRNTLFTYQVFFAREYGDAVKSQNYVISSFCARKNKWHINLIKYGQKNGYLSEKQLNVIINIATTIIYLKSIPKEQLVQPLQNVSLNRPQLELSDE